MKVLILAFIVSLSLTAFAEELPEDSVYQVGGTWQTQDNQSIQLESLAGKPQVIAIIFTGCSNSCPIIIESMRNIERKMPQKMQGKVGFLLVSLTPDTDFPKTLKAFAEKRKLSTNWTLLRGNNETVRALSNALNGRYKVIKDGDIAHSNTVTLLTNQGQIDVQTSGTMAGVKPIIDKIESDYSAKSAGTK